VEILQFLDNIYFNSIKKRPRINKTETIAWLNDIAEKERFTIVGLSYTFCNDDYLLQINREHLNHDYLTDIITFDLSDMGNLIDGDIYISIDRVKDNAKQMKVSPSLELKRVMAHGLLHLMGYDDKTNAGKIEMRAKEDECLALIQNHVPRETIT
jgi:probable rRNA maturation factor